MIGRPVSIPYHDFSVVYDEYLAHVDFSMWANYILKLWHLKHAQMPASVLDIACGTGEIIKYFARKKISCSGLDISEKMILVASEKMKNEGLAYNWLRVEDMRDIRYKDKFDLCCCNFDSINYLNSDVEVAALFSCVYEMVENDGVFIFDVATPFLCSEYYDGTREIEQIGEMVVERKSDFDSSNNQLLTEFKFSHRESAEVKKEYHRQSIFNHETLLSLLKVSGFKEIKYFSDFSTKPGYQEDSMRIHYVAVK